MSDVRPAPPVPGGIICGRYPYAWRRGEQVSHLGIDFCAARGTPIYAVLGGTALQIRTTEHGGRNFLVRHAPNLYSYYAHCDTILVRDGEQVGQWQRIATVGQTGVNSLGRPIDPHLHWQVMRGVFEGHLDPLALLRELGIVEGAGGVMVWTPGYPKSSNRAVWAALGLSAAILVGGGVVVAVRRRRRKLWVSERQGRITAQEGARHGRV